MSEPRPPPPHRLSWGIAVALVVFALISVVFVRLAPVHAGLEVDRLAEGHPNAVVVEVVDPDPSSVAATRDLLARFPALGTPHVGQGPGWVGPAGEARILLHPDAPVPVPTLNALALAVDSRPDVRWTLAPGERAWPVPRALRPLVALAVVGGLALLSWGLRRSSQGRVSTVALRAGLPLLSATVVLWGLQPVAPAVFAFLPMAVVVGWFAAGSRLPWAALGALPLLATGHPYLQAIGVLVATPAACGAVLAWWRPSDAREPIDGGSNEAGGSVAGRAAVILAVGLLIAAVAAPPAPPASLLERLPQTATVPTPTDSALQALQAHGLGTIEGAVAPGADPVLQAHQERLGERVAVPLAGPWVAAAFSDTLAAEAPGVALSVPRRAPARIPWLWIGVFGVVFVSVRLSSEADPKRAVARLTPALGAVPALVWLGSGVGPEVAVLAACLTPLLAAVVVMPRETPVEEGVFSLAPSLPFVALGLGDLAVAWVSGAVLGALLRRAIPSIAAGVWPSRPVRRWVPRLVWVGVLLVHIDVLVLLLVGFSPPPPGEPLGDQVERDGRALVLGRHRLHRENGVFVLATKGAPYETGLAAATLANPLRRRLEVELFDAYVANVPYAGARWLVSRGSAVVGSGLDAELLQEHRVELRGDIDAAPEHYAFAGPSYTRKVYYHAIHDIGQALVDTPLLGCTGFAASPEVTPDQHWRIGRAFDFDGGVAFDRDKVIRLHEPEDGHAFLSVAFAGIVGAVSGVNEAGIAVVINASGSEDPPRPGTPMTLIVREILQHASTLDEAQAILDARTGFVSENVLVVDADADRAALFEVSPARVARLDVDDWLAFSNHFRTEAFADDPVNADRMRELTTVPRLQRAEELVERHVGVLDQRAGAAILSDRRGVGDAPLPRGHRHALNADIATHGVVIDATERSLWVSVYPNLSGGWVSLSLDDARAGRLAPIREISADPDAWRAVEIRTARELLRASRRSRSARASRLAERALQIWPDHPEPLLEAGVHRLEAGDPSGSRLLEQAESAPLEYRHQARTIEAARVDLGGP